MNLGVLSPPKRGTARTLLNEHIERRLIPTTVGNALKIACKKPLSTLSHAKDTPGYIKMDQLQTTRTENTMKAALLDRNNRVIGDVYDAPESGHWIDIAGAFTADGDPVNVRSYRISRSKRNLEKARFEQVISKVNGVWVFCDFDDDHVMC